MASYHVHAHGHVFQGLEIRDLFNVEEKRDSVKIAEDDNKAHFIHNRPHLGLKHDLGAEAKKVVKIAADGNKAHIVQDKPGVGLRHDLGLAYKQPKKVLAEDGKYHFIHDKSNGLVHDLGVAKKDPIKVLGDDGKFHLVHDKPESGLRHVLGLADEKAAVVETVYSQVYVTEAKTFSGPAQYVTVTGSTPTTSASLNSAEAAYESAKSAANAPETAPASSTPVAVATTTSSTSYRTTPIQLTRSTGATVVKGTPHTTSRAASTVIGGTPLSQSATSSPDASHKSGGTTAGASAGIAFGVIFALALCGGLFFFCWRRRKQQKDRAGAEKLDEKHASQNSFFSGTAAAVGAPAGNLRGSVQSEKNHTAATAPRLSLRPVTQSFYNILGGTSTNSEPTRNGPQMSEKPKSGWERTPAGTGQNPFEDAAVIDEKQARPVSPLNPFEEGDAAVVAAGKQSPSHSSKGSWEGSEPPTPKSTKFGTAAAVPIAAAGAAAGPKAPAGPNNVHRVQLDFKPSMDDELELRSGQIVRMLHEYDDGWCLCIRMDRSQQGVCPRTCLSKLPVKPRPQGPPPQNGQSGRPRGPPPPGMMPRAQSPAMSRPQSPAMRDNMVPRPLTPTGRERSHTGPRMSPAPHNARPRSQSMGGASERPESPVGMPSRKPVPGQAL